LSWRVWNHAEVDFSLERTVKREQIVKEIEVKKVEPSEAELNELQEELRLSKRDWDNAIRHFDYALGKDQIDYAIFAIGAAEKRYEMLLRKAKAMNVDWPKWQEAVV